MDLHRGPVVVIPAGYRGIPGSIPGDYNRILILWTVTPSLVKAFHVAFYSFPQPATSVVRHHCRVFHPVHCFRMFSQVCLPVHLALLHLTIPGDKISRLHHQAILWRVVFEYFSLLRRLPLETFPRRRNHCFQFHRAQCVPLVALALIVILRQAEAESFVRVKVEINHHRRLRHVEQDHLVLPHASTKYQMNFCIYHTLINFL